MCRTVALYDVIGISDAFEQGNAAVLLETFWNAAEAWANLEGARTPRFIPRLNRQQVPFVRVRTISDSAVLTMDPEPAIQDFYEVALGLLRAIERAGLRCYVVMCTGALVEAGGLPATGGHVVDRSGNRAFENVLGSGESWVNVYLGDRCVGRTREWHDRFNVYAVGEASIQPGTEPQEHRTFTGFGGREETVFAVR